MSNYAEIACSLVVSAYKGLTSTLLAAQQSSALQPYFNAKIIDDTIQPSQVLGGPATPTGNGNSVTAPDGSILSVGLDGSGNVVLCKGSNLHGAAWDSTTTVEAAGGTFNQSFNQYSVAVSDWYQGSYVVLVCFFDGLVNSGASNVRGKGYVSFDGGVTFTLAAAIATGITGDQYFSPLLRNLSIAAMMPRLVGTTMKFGWFINQPLATNFISPGEVGYSIRYAYGDISGVTGYTEWSQKFANSQDWDIQSLAAFYKNGRDYIVLSGFRMFIDTPNLNVSRGNNHFSQIIQYGIWITELIQINQNNDNTDSVNVGDVWFPPEPLLTSIAVSNTNFNSFTSPKVNMANGMVYLTFTANVVEEINSQTLGRVTLQGYTFQMSSRDGRNFNYPQQMILADGTRYLAASTPSFPNQGQYFYLMVEGQVWEYVRNNIVADISNDVVQYTVTESAGQPSSITLQLANQQNQWYPNGTNPGAAAIKGGRKVIFEQGYYTLAPDGSGVRVPESVPRNVYFIDDINQNTSNTDNNLTISARDFYKYMKQLITKWAFNWFGPFSYADSFDGTTIGNWNQADGTWYEGGNVLTTTTAPSSDSNILLTTIPRITNGSNLAVGVKGKATGHAYVYAYYFDDDNWLRLNYNFATTPHIKVEKCVGGIITALVSENSASIPNGETHMVYIRQFNYFRFMFVISAVDSNNNIDAWTSTHWVGNTTYDLSADVLALQSQQWSVGLGASGVIPGFTEFQYSQNNASNNVSDIVQRLGTKASIFDYDIEQNFEDFFFDPAAWYPGGDSLTDNRVLNFSGGAVFKTDEVISDGEIAFRASCIPNPGQTSFRLDFNFRTDNFVNPTSAYRLSFSGSISPGSGQQLGVTLARLYNGTYYPFPSFQNQSGVGFPTGGLNFDIRIPHDFKVMFASGWVYVFIDEIMVYSWNDNNNTSDFLETGYIGFGATTSCTAYISRVTSTAFWKQSPSFSLNPGDDVENGVLNVLQTIRSFVFSDLWGRFKAVLLSSNDTSTYEYDEQIFMQGVDTSDKEYVNQVTVYGNGVSATARDNTLMAGAAVREEPIVDYTILTANDAQTRADNELINANQFRLQLNPKQVMNVGSELFDVVDIVDVGSNNSGVDTNSRVYSQKFTTGGSNNEFSLEIDTGNV